MGAVEDFLKRAAEDNALRKEILRAQVEAAAAVAAAHGFRFTAEEYLAALSTLDEAELDTITGGAEDTRYSNLDTNYLLKSLESFGLPTPLASNYSTTLPTPTGSATTTGTPLKKLP